MFRELSFIEAMDIINNNYPKGLFLLKDKCYLMRKQNLAIAIDTRGEEVTIVQFHELNKCIRYMKSIGA